MHNEVLYSLYSSAAITMVVKSRLIRCAGYLTRREGEEKNYSESLKEDTTSGHKRERNIKVEQ
jgi:hypothetical protein